MSIFNSTPPSTLQTSVSSSSSTISSSAFATSSSTPSHKINHIIIPVVSSILGVFVLTVALALFIWRRKSRQPKLPAPQRRPYISRPFVNPQDAIKFGPQLNPVDLRTFGPNASAIESSSAPPIPAKSPLRRASHTGSLPVIQTHSDGFYRPGYEENGEPSPSNYQTQRFVPLTPEEIRENWYNTAPSHHICLRELRRESRPLQQTLQKGPPYGVDDRDTMSPAPLRLPQRSNTSASEPTRQLRENASSNEQYTGKGKSRADSFEIGAIGESQYACTAPAAYHTRKASTESIHANRQKAMELLEAKPTDEEIQRDQEIRRAQEIQRAKREKPNVTATITVPKDSEIPLNYFDRDSIELGPVDRFKFSKKKGKWKALPRP
jgi:hypothetical protein